MKIYKNVDIDGSLVVTVAVNNSLHVDTNGLIYSKQNTYGSNYIQYDDSGLNVFNSTSTGYSSMSFANNQLYVYINGGTNFVLNEYGLNIFGSGYGNISLNGGGINVADYSSGGALTLYSLNAIKIQSGGSGSAYVKTSLLSDDRNFQFPDNSGTLALTTDIPAVAVTYGTNTAGQMYNGYSGNSVLYNASGTPDAGQGFSWNAALDNTGGIYSAQMYIGCSAGPGQNFDSFFYRANQQGGVGWPTPWYQVASRAWVGNQNYLTSFTESDPVYTAAIPNIFMYKASLTSGQDLNTILITGLYSASNAVSGTLVNTPQSGSPFILEILKNTAAGLYTLQRATYNGNVSYRRFSGDGGTTWTVWSKVVGSTDVILNGNSQQASSNFNISGNGTVTKLSIGANISTFSSLMIGKTITGSVNAFGVRQEGSVQSDVSNGYGFYNLGTVASGHTLGDYNHYAASQNVIPVDSSISRQLGFRASSNMIGATNNYGFYGEIPSGTGRWNLYMSGTAQNYFAGNVGIGVTTPSTALHLASGKVIRLAGLTSSIIKTNSNGDIVAAIAGVDYITTVPNNGTLNLSTTGILSGSATFTADQSGNSTFTVTAPSYGNIAGTIAQGNDSRFHNAVTIGVANGLTISTQVLSLGLASTSTTGALSSTDWNIFNNKAPATGSANYIQNQYTTGQTANMWINGIVRANCFAADGYGYTIAAQSDYYGFFTDSSFGTALPIKAKSLVLSSSYSTTAPVNGLYVEGGVKLNSLAGTGVRMVTADASGNLSFDVIPTGVDQWSTNGYNYLSANSINNGVGSGIHTGGGFASSTHLITGDYTLADNIHTVVRLNAGGTFKLYMPNPADFEDREIQIRNATHGSQSPVLIQSYPIYYFANNSSSSNNQVIQVNGDSTTGGVEYYTAVTIKSVRCVINSVDSYYWLVINKI